MKNRSKRNRLLVFISEQYIAQANSENLNLADAKRSISIAFSYL